MLALYWFSFSVAHLILFIFPPSAQWNTCFLVPANNRHFYSNKWTLLWMTGEIFIPCVWSMLQVTSMDFWPSLTNPSLLFFTLDFMTYDLWFYFVFLWLTYDFWITTSAFLSLDSNRPFLFSHNVFNLISSRKKVIKSFRILKKICAEIL